MSLDRHLQRLWYGAFSPWLILLVPLSWLFAAIVALRRALFRWGLLRSYRLDVPVIVIGNITVGGTGKTPFTIWLATQLAASGRKVGIILRGYGGRATTWPQRVTRASAWEEVGDEAVLLARRTDAIVVAGPDRVADAQLAKELGAEIILSDDGLQHYRLQRRCEIVVVDGRRGLGNGRLLPAGPLREPIARLSRAELQVTTQRGEDSQRAIASGVPGVTARSRLGSAVNLVTGEVRSLASFAGAPVHAIAAIGHPEAFFEALQRAGLDVRGHAYPDHERLTRELIVFAQDPAVLMTEKDAVKCMAIADRRHWVVPLEVTLSDEDMKVVETLIGSMLGPSRGEIDGY